MSKEPTNGHSAEEASRKLCDVLGRRTGTSYEVILGLNDEIREILVNEDWDNIIPPFHSSHDSLQRVIDVMTPEELKRMNRVLWVSWRGVRECEMENEDSDEAQSYELWLIRRDLQAFVAAALVAVGEGE